jgi:hypothetical protein
MLTVPSADQAFPPSPRVSQYERLGEVMRIARYVLVDRVLRPVPKRIPQIPRSPEAISAEWLTSVLCAAHPNAAVTVLEAGRASSGSTNRRHFRLQYNQAGREAGLPEALFVKSTATLTTRILNGLSGMIRGEVGFYNQVRPELKVETPLGYFAGYDPASYRSIVVLEDIAATRGASFCTTSEALSLEQMRGIVGLLAKCHGHYFGSPRLDREFMWLKTPLEFQLEINGSLDFRKMCDRGTARSAAVIPPELLPRGDDIWRAFARSLILNAEGPRMLLHGDAHIRNFYSTRAGVMGACDWQITMKGHWAFDFAYAVISGLTVEQRRRWERELLEYYLAEFAQAGGKTPPFEEAWLAYRRHTIYPYYGFLVVMGAGSLLPAMQPEAACLDIIGRTANAIVDLDSLSALGA